MHFQDRGPYGRITHLQPVEWKDGWPLMGIDINNDGIGEPVLEYEKPDVGQIFPISVPQTSDEFNDSKLGLQWQWHANPKKDWYSLSANPGYLRLYAVKNLSQNGNFWFVPNLLLQKFPAPSFTAVTKITAGIEQPGEKAGLVIMGGEWGYLAMSKTQTGVQAAMFKGMYDRGNDATELIEAVEINDNSCYFKVSVSENAECTFSYSLTGEDFKPIGKSFTAKKDLWIGAKVGLFCINPNITDSRAFADFDFFRLE